MPTAFSHDKLEFCWIGNAAGAEPVWVFLHEGLGSVSMWRDWPAQVCATLGVRGLLYSRSGYGASPAPAGFGRRGSQRFKPDYMHVEAWDVLPRLLADLGIERPVLLGHSDGATIALLHASRHSLTGCAVMAPHLFVEASALAAIAATTEAFAASDGQLRQRLARYHADVDTAFWQWSDVWLNPKFTTFNIEAECARITCPVLAIQGAEDEYGTFAQLDVLSRCAPQTEQLRLSACKHSPHRDQSDTVIAALEAWWLRIAQQQTSTESKSVRPRGSN